MPAKGSTEEKGICPVCGAEKSKRRMNLHIRAKHPGTDENTPSDSFKSGEEEPPTPKKGGTTTLKPLEISQELTVSKTVVKGSKTEEKKKKSVSNAAGGEIAGMDQVWILLGEVQNRFMGVGVEKEWDRKGVKVTEKEAAILSKQFNLMINKDIGPGWGFLISVLLLYGLPFVANLAAEAMTDEEGKSGMEKLIKFLKRDKKDEKDEEE